MLQAVSCIFRSISLVSRTGYIVDNVKIKCLHFIKYRPFSMTKLKFERVLERVLDIHVSYVTVSVRHVSYVTGSV